MRNNQKNQWMFVKQLNKEYNNFIPDVYMNKILTMENFNKKNLESF